MIRFTCPACVIAIAVLTCPAPVDAQQPKPPPIREYRADAPQIPLLTKLEAAYVNQVIYAMVLDDLGLPKGVPRDRSLIQRNFNALGPESLPLLVEWMDYAANKYGTCPSTILGKKIMHYVNRTGNEDWDTIELIDQKLGKGLTVKDLPDAYKDLRANIDRTLKSKRKDKALTLNAMKFDEVLKLAKGVEDDAKARKLADWRGTIGFIGAKKKEGRAFDFLLGALEKADTPSQRKTVHEALKNWSGADKGPAFYENASETKLAVENWKEWRRDKK